MSHYRNRIVETRLVSADELRANPKNWKQHGATQRNVVTGLLETIGIFDTLLAYYSAREGGALTLINGHLRQEIGGEWPVKITDLNDEEADLVLAAFDPSASLAEMDSAALGALLQGLQTVEEGDGQSAGSLLSWLAEMQEEAALLDATQLADAKASGGGKRGTYGTVVKLALVAEDVFEIERALAATENRNRAQALLEICHWYLESHAKGQQYTQLESLVAAQSASGN